MANEFLNLKLNSENMLYFQVRTAIERAFLKNVYMLKGKVLDLGCGTQPYKELIQSNKKVESYIGIDIDFNNYHNKKPDLYWDGLHIPLEDESIDCVVITEFLEHYFDTGHILTEIKRVLKPGGIIFGTVPFIWNLHEIPFDEYRFTPFSLKKYFEKAGYKISSVHSLGGKNAAFAQFIGLWYSISNFRFKSILKFPIFLIYRYLVNNDIPNDNFDDWQNSLYSGLYFIVEK
jgi:ubiquinone/menaquinone biosynthesis C-methylase UbiE